MPMTLETEPIADATPGLKPGEIALVEVRHDPSDEPRSPVTLYGGGMEDETVEQEGATDVSCALGTGEGESASVDKPTSDIIGTALEDSTPTDRVDVIGNRLHEASIEIVGPATQFVSDALDRLREIAQASRELSNVREQIVTAAGEVKALKEEEKGLAARLLRLTAAVANDSTRPLLNVATEAKSDSARHPAETGAAGDYLQPNESDTSPAAPSVDANAWRAYRLDDPNHFPELVSQKSLVAKLAEAEIETVGQMVDFQSTGKDLTDIKGIGSGKAEKISDAMETFWRDHPDLVQAAVDAS
jgi:hypothetical protein